MIACSPRSFTRPVPPLITRLLLGIVILAGVMPAPAQAQLSTSSHWGVNVSFTPTWKTLDQLKEVFVEEEGTLEGTEFTLGIARGSMRGGEWSVSYVHKPVRDTAFVESEQFCDFGPSCLTATRTLTFQDVVLKGVEYVWSKPFVTFANRVQVGINVGGGAAWVHGTITETHDLVQPPLPPLHDEVSNPAKDTLWPVYPLGKVEAMGSFIIAPGLKIKVSGGFNFPAASFRIGAVYLFGAS
jgi:hypothetical protein